MKEIDVLKENDEYAKIMSVNDMIFVTHLTPDSSTRYRFIMNKKNANNIVYSRDKNITPPRIVIDILNKNNYNVTNIPNISEDNLIKRIEQVINALEWIDKHGGLNSNDVRRHAYERALTGMPTIYYSLISKEAIGSEEFTKQLGSYLEQSTNYTKENLVNSRIFNIEELQQILINVKNSLPLRLENQINEYTMEILDKDMKHSEIPSKWGNYSETTLDISSEAKELLIENGWDV